jgi:hypothetical protein
MVKWCINKHVQVEKLGIKLIAMAKANYIRKVKMAKTFKQMNKDELIKATESLGLTEKVAESAKDKDNITNAEYVTVLEEFKASQDEINSETKKDIEKQESKVEKSDSDGSKVIKTVVDQHERAKLKQVKYKYIVTDHQSRIQVEDDDETRTFPIQYGNLTTGPKNWNVALHGNPQALPFSVAKRLESIPMTIPTKNAKGDPVVKTQPRFRVTRIDGWTQDEIDSLKRSQNTRKFKD